MAGTAPTVPERWGRIRVPCTGCSGLALAWLSCDAVLPDRCHSASAKRSRGGFALAIPSRAMGRVSSSISREIARHGGQGRYRALGADAQRPKPCHLAQHPALARMVAQKLRLNWSPQQITAWLERQFGNDDSRRVPHETIYRSLFIQTREVLKKKLLAHLRRGRSMRYGRAYRGTVGSGVGTILEAPSVCEQSAQAEDRAVPGHWEGDLLCGTPGTQIATLVERRSRFLILVKLPSKDSPTVANALVRHVKKLPKLLRRSLTWD